MQILNLIQGTAEWHAHRASHFNASDAPAMMGCSLYKTRSQLLAEMHSGITPEVDVATQKRFDNGHRVEALARPLAEEIVGEEFYPVVGSEGRLSASFDGLTMTEDLIFEHKALNKDLQAVMVEGCTGADLPLMYQVQMEQQCMVSGAPRALFMASAWSGEDLIEERHCFYEANPVLAEKIAAGWEQFAIDLDSYQPTAAAVESVGRSPEALPALRIEVTGAVTASNLSAFKEHALAVFAGINRELQTDQQFADAEKTVKWCGDVEERLAAAKQHALSQTETIDALFRTIDDISAEARRVRLDLDKLVKARKEAVRGEIVAAGAKALADHVAALNARLGKPYMPPVHADFGGAIKGKKNLDSMRDAVATMLAATKISASSTADGIQINLGTLRELASQHVFLFPDVPQIVLKASDDLTALVKSRIAEHEAKERAKEEAQRERIRLEEAARVEREHAEKLRQEQAAAAAAVVPAPAAPSVAATPAPAVVPFTRPAVPAVEPTTAPSLTLGQIGKRLGFSLTADFVRTLGFEPAGRDRAAVLFHEAQFPHLCAALVDHIQSVQAKQAA